MTRARRTLSVVTCMFTAAVFGCGKKGPPQAPLIIVPSRIAPIDVTRLDDRVYIEFDIPDANSNGDQPADIDRVELYAVTTQPTRDRPPEPFGDDWLHAATLVATIRVRPPRPPGAPIDEAQADADGEAVAVDDTLSNPGYADQGEAVTIVEQLTPELFVPVMVGDAEDEDDEDDEPEYEPRPHVAPLVSPQAPLAMLRTYVALGVTTRDRDGPNSAMTAIPLVATPVPPAPPVVTYTATAITITWEDSPSVRQPIQEEASDDVLESEPILEGPEPSTYLVYDIAGPMADDEKPESLAVAQETTTYTDSTVVFGETRCYAVRVQATQDGLELQGVESPATCVILTDTFAPAAPTGLLAVADDGATNLAWNENTEPDVAGYVILRGAASDATLQPLAPDPIVQTTFRDDDVQAGERYAYQVHAIDTAVPPNVSPSSERIVETAR